MRRDIMLLTGIDANQYNNLQIDLARLYLTKRMGMDDQSAQLIEGTRQFWMWWLNHWRRRDQLFIRGYNRRVRKMKKSDQKQLKLHYLDAHSIETIDQYPGAFVMDATYEEMISDIIEETNLKRHQNAETIEASKKEKTHV